MMAGTFISLARKLHAEVMRSMRTCQHHHEYVEIVRAEAAFTQAMAGKYEEYGRRGLLKPRACPLCGREASSVVLPMRGMPPRAYTRCVPCDFVFENPCLDEKDYNLIYKTSCDGMFDEARERCHRLGMGENRITEYRPLDIIKARQATGGFLDFGCGTGWVMKLARERYGYDVYGIDIDPNAIAKARELIGDPGRIYDGSAVDEAALAGGFDIIHSNQNLEHLLFPAAYIRKFHSWLRPGGLLFLSFPLSDSFAFGFLGERNAMTQIGHVSLFSERSIKTLLSQNGFADVEFSAVHLDVSAIEFVRTLLGLPFAHRRNYINSRAAMVLMYLPLACLTAALQGLHLAGVLKGNYSYVIARKKDGGND